MNLKIVGTSHIARESVKEVQEAIADFSPEIVAVELDLPRYNALLGKKKEGIGLKDIRYFGIKGFIFALIGSYVEKKLAEKAGTKLGDDMLSAIKMAKKMNLKIALIDQPLNITLHRFSKKLSWKEKWNFVVDLFKGIFFGKRQMKEMGFENLDLTKLPGKEVIRKAMLFAKKRYPNFYNVLVEERNVYMVRQLNMIIAQNPEAKVLAVVGAGHEDGMRELLGQSL